MISSLRATGFRAFRSLTVEKLGRVNLFVGKNGCGKTSVLEAAALLASEGSPRMLFEIVSNRGEVIGERREPPFRRGYDIRHLFHGHLSELGSSFRVESSGIAQASVLCEIVDASPNSPDLFQPEPSPTPTPSPEDESEAPFPVFVRQLGISIRCSATEKPLILPLSAWGGISWETLRRFGPIDRGEKIRPVCFLPIEGLAHEDMAFYWDEIALTREEEHVIEALRIIEPQIERIAFLSRNGERRSTGIFAKLKDGDDRLPLGTLGDGIRRMLGLSLAVIRSAGSCAMLDEIGAGLHYSVMSTMWRMVIQTAERLDVQVFATTHSQDCVRALATLYREAPELCEHVRLHRIDKDLDKAVTYLACEISSADEHRVEVR